MFDVVRKEIEYAGETLSMETGRVARQADGAVIVTLGETSVLAAVTFEKKPKVGFDFFPLTVHYQEKFYAAGKIPGGYLKREARPSEKETLTSRLIDRPIRPLFIDGFKNETQVICTVLSHDLENDPDMVAMIAASAALTISGAPFMGPIGGCRVGYINGEYKLNPSSEDLEDSKLDLVMAGTQDAVMMVESEASELSEDVMLGAVMFGHKSIQPVIDLIISLAEEAAKEPFDVNLPDNSAINEKVKGLGEAAMREAFGTVDKSERTDKVSAARDTIKAGLTEEELEDNNAVGGAIKKLEKSIVRGDIVKTGKRIDGRDLSTVRAIESHVGVLPRTHGSALFTRGETQALCITTLGTGDDEQRIDALDGDYRERFLLHYNFPPYSVGEAGRFGPPGRREVGHGKLAWRALRAVLPAATDFPYTIRIVSEITESNGSSSMASVCGGSLSMMDAGVPLTRPVAGVAMGLILEESGEFAVLTDILGDEDHLGDMDFKVAGTTEGITSLQMDIKVAGITEDIMKQALSQAHEGRNTILTEMSKALSAGRQEFSEHAPRIETMQINPDKIREVIGSGGKVIRGIVEESGAKVDINDEGIIKIASSNAEQIEKAKEMIMHIAAEPEVGMIYDGKVVKVMEFGAFVNFFGPKDGLVHISEMSNDRGSKPSDHVKEGDVVKVKLLGFADRGKVKLSMKAVDQTTGEDLTAG